MLYHFWFLFNWPIISIEDWVGEPHDFFIKRTCKYQILNLSQIVIKLDVYQILINLI